MTDVIASHGVQYHQYADDTQLRLAIHADNTYDGLSILAACTADVKQWYMHNGLQPNSDKSEALIIGIGNQLHAVTSAVTSVSLANVDLLMALSVVLDRCLTFRKHAMVVARSYNYHSQAIRHIHRPLSTELVVILASSLLRTGLDYCNSVLYSAAASSIQVVQRVHSGSAVSLSGWPAPSA